MQLLAAAILVIFSNGPREASAGQSTLESPALPESGPAGAKQAHLQLLFELALAEVAEPERVAAVLATLKLAPMELGRLNGAEAGEMAEAMRLGEVALGDRFRLRLLSEQLEQTMRQ